MPRRLISFARLPLCVALAGALVWACGSDDGNMFADSDASNTDASTQADTPMLIQPDGSNDSGTPFDPDATCASTSAKAKLAPVNVVVAYDRSGSMGDTTEDPSYDPKLRWLPVGAALKDFFADSKSTGMRASLTYFPDTATNVACTIATYSTPAVALTDLPSALFATSINATSPRGDTPTQPAMDGAIAQAKAVAAAHPGEKTIIIFATDGEPAGCDVDPGSDAQVQAAVTATSKDVAAIASTIPTYVIGVGPSVNLLNQVAAAGGTKQALLVSVGNPAQTNADLIAALNLIRGSVIDCDFAIPTPADNRPIDYNKVSVEFTPNGGAASSLTYNPTCAGNTGWHYDDPTTPKKVSLCTGSCNAVRSDPAGSISVGFKCIDQQVVVPN